VTCRCLWQRDIYGWFVAESTWNTDDKRALHHPKRALHLRAGERARKVAACSRRASLARAMMIKEPYITRKEPYIFVAESKWNTVCVQKAVLVAAALVAAVVRDMDGLVLTFCINLCCRKQMFWEHCLCPRACSRHARIPVPALAPPLSPFSRGAARAACSRHARIPVPVLASQ